MRYQPCIGDIMNRTIIAAIVCGLAVAATGVSLALTGSTVAAAATGTADVAREVAITSAAPHYVLVDCASSGDVKPSGYVFACADGNAGLTGMNWTSFATARQLFRDLLCEQLHPELRPRAFPQLPGAYRGVGQRPGGGTSQRAALHRGHADFHRRPAARV